jgi:uncharacterized protein involved in exopolysaccharide biosynthesis
MIEQHSGSIPTAPARNEQREYSSCDSRGAETVDLFLLATIVWRGKWLISGIAALFALLGIAYVLLATPVYRAVVVLSPNSFDQDSGILENLGGLASLAGLGGGLSADSTEAVAILQSRAFVEDYISEKELLPILFEDDWNPTEGAWASTDPDDWPDIRDGVEKFTDEIRAVREDSITGLVTLSIDWTDPTVAAVWAEELVERVNQRIRDRDLRRSELRLAYLNEALAAANLVELRVAISRLIETEIQSIMMAKAEVEYAFRVVDPARVPKDEIRPRKAVILSIITSIGVLLGAFFAIARQVYVNRRGEGE